MRDLLAVPPERRALAEERLQNNRRRITVDALVRERVQGLTEVMLLLERATKAADGVSGHLVIEISCHTGPSRTSVGGSVVGRAVLFGVCDEVEKGKAEPALYQLASLLHDCANGGRGSAASLAPGSPGGSGGAGMGLAGRTPLLHVMSTVIEADSVPRISMLITVSDSSEEEAHRRNLEALSAANRIVRQRSAARPGKDGDAASGACVGDGITGSAAGLVEDNTPLPFPNWNIAWENTLRVDGDERAASVSPSHNWSRSPSRSSSSRSPAKTASPPKTPSSTSDKGREVKFLGQGMSVKSEGRALVGAQPWLSADEPQSNAPDSDTTVLFRRPSASSKLAAAAPAAAAAQALQVPSAGDYGVPFGEKSASGGAAREGGVVPEAARRRARQAERHARSRDEDEQAGVSGDVTATEASDGDGKWDLSPFRQQPAAVIAAGGSGGMRERGVGAGDGTEGRERRRVQREGEEVPVDHSGIAKVHRQLADAMRRAAQAEQQLRAMEAERKFQELESEAVVDMAAREKENVEREREALLARIAELESKVPTSSSSSQDQRGATWSPGKWRHSPAVGGGRSSE